MAERRYYSTTQFHNVVSLQFGPNPNLSVTVPLEDAQRLHADLANIIRNDPGDLASAPPVFLASVLYDPETKRADRAVVVVEQPPRTTRIQIDLEPTPIGDPSIPDHVARLLRELGEALRHTADAPLAINTHHQHQT